MIKPVYAISKLKDYPPRQLPMPKFEKKEEAYAYTQELNEQHRNAETGEVFKVFILA